MIPGQEGDFDFFRRYMIEWSNDWPYDYWWRKKHKIAFGSEEHLKTNPIDQRLEFEEDKLHNEFRTDKRQEEYDYYRQTGQVLKPQPRFNKMSKDEEEFIYDNIDLSAFDDKPSNVTVK